MELLVENKKIKKFFSKSKKSLAERISQPTN